MSVLRGILELQGSLDTAVVRTGDPRVAAIADRFLPGTSANSEWYREIEAFMFPGEPRTDANPVRALQEIVSASDGHRLTAQKASRLMFSLGAVVHLTENFPEELELPFEDPTAGPEDSVLADILMLTAPEGAFERSADSERREITEILGQVFSTFANVFGGWQDWDEVADQLVALNVLTEEAASVPLCKPSVVVIDGLEAVVVDTEFSSTKVSLNNVKDRVDPRNWDENYPAFFCKMEYKGLRTDGWRRVLETVGVCYFPEPFGRRLRTMLKFYKYTPSASEARLDYDLNDPVPDPRGDGQITIDRGFINLTAPSGNPDDKQVKVRTRKVARIEGLRPYTMKRFVCVFGYAYAAIEMILGSANDPNGLKHRVPWLDPLDEKPEDPDQPSDKPSDSQPYPDNSAASTAITMAVKCVEEMSAKQFDMTDKWLAGQLTLDDLAQYTAEVGARIASEPWRIMQAIAKSKGAAK